MFIELGGGEGSSHLNVNLRLVGRSSSRERDKIADKLLRHISRKLGSNRESFSASGWTDTKNVALVQKQIADQFRISNIIHGRYFDVWRLDIF